MEDWPMPLKAALTVAAVAWPFVAGLGIVLWSKARAARKVRANPTSLGVRRPPGE
jgi:hypothetical protein